jgi:hypothetical protein
MLLILCLSFVLLGVTLGLSGYPLTGFAIAVGGVVIIYVYEPVKKLFKK